MKKLVFILSVMVLLLAIVPCCLADSCTNDKPSTPLTSTEKKPTHPDTVLYSPFFQCHSCSGFAYTLPVSGRIIFFFNNTKTFSIYCPPVFTNFTPSIWQPPKIASVLLVTRSAFLQK